MRAVGAALAADRASEAVLFPVDQAAPGRSASALEDRRHLVERRLAALRAADSVEQRLGETSNSGTPFDVEQQPDEANGNAGEDELELVESSRDERKRDAGDRDQLGPVAELVRRDDRQPVGSRGVPELRELVVRQYRDGVLAASDCDERLGDGRM